VSIKRKFFSSERRKRKLRKNLHREGKHSLSTSVSERVGRRHLAWARRKNDETIREGRERGNTRFSVRERSGWKVAEVGKSRETLWRDGGGITSW